MVRIYLFFVFIVMPLLAYNQESIDPLMNTIVDSILVEGDHYRKVKKDRKKAIEVYQVALDYSLDKFGNQSIEFGHSMYRMALAYSRISYPESIEYFDKAEQVYALHGTAYLEQRVKCLYNCCFMKRALGDDDESLEYALRTLENGKNTSNIQNKTISICFDILTRQNRLDECLDLFESRKDKMVFRQNFDFNVHYVTLLFREQEVEKALVHASLIEKHFLNVEGFSNFYRNRRLASLFKTLYVYEKAEYYFLECERLEELTIFDSTKKLSSLGRHKINYANFCFKIGAFKKAEEIYLKLIESPYNKSFSGDIIKALYENLSVLYIHLGATEKAAYYLTEFYKEKSGKLKEREEIAYWANLATCYQKEGALVMAKEALERAIDRFIAMKKVDRDVQLKLYTNMAAIYLQMGQVNDARSNIELALEGVENGDLYFNYFYARNLLAGIRIEEGLYEEAELDLNFVYENLRFRESENYAKVVELLNRYIILYIKTENFEKAERYCKELADFSMREITDQYTYLPSSAREKYLERIAYRQVLKIQSYSAFIGGEQMAELQVRLGLFIKGLQLKTNVDYNAYLASASDPYILALKDSLDDLKVLNKLSYSDNLKLYSIQRKLQEEVTSSNTQNLLNSTEIKYVSNLLKRKSAYVQFLTYEEMDSSETKMIGASILNAKGEVEFIPICRKDAIESMLDVKELVSGNYRGIKVLKVDQSRRLYNLIWAPLAPYLQKNVYYSSTGILNFINLGILESPEGKSVFESYDLLMISSAASLAPTDAVDFKSNKRGLLVGGVDYDPKSENRGNTYAPYWPYLSGSSMEIAQIKLMYDNSFQLEVLEGEGAKEELLKKKLNRKDTPRFLHIATHGHYEKADSGINLLKFDANSMFNSCLVLSGANNLGSDFLTYEQSDDGILTAAELSNLNLQGTELVVLSSCNSGMGDISSFEGMFGLARALKLAGVKYVIMTLSPIPDDIQMIEFVRVFYKNYLDKDRKVPEAFRRAQSAMVKLYGKNNDLTNFILYK
jgi:CHAT domain-containing protein